MRTAGLWRTRLSPLSRWGLSSSSPCRRHLHACCSSAPTSATTSATCCSCWSPSATSPDAEVVAAAPFAADMRAAARPRHPRLRPAAARRSASTRSGPSAGRSGAIDLARAYRLSASPAGVAPLRRAPPRRRRAAILRREATGGAPLASPYIPLPSAFPRNAGAADGAQLGRHRRRRAASSRRAARRCSPRCAAPTAITVRDRGSSRLLTDLGIEHALVPDAVHALGVLRPGARDRRGRPRSCRSRARGCGCSATSGVGQALAAQPAARGPAGAAAARRHRDRPRRRGRLRARRARAAARRSTSRSSRSAARSTSPTASADARVVVGTSLHVRIVAAAYGVPRVSLAKPKPTRYAAPLGPRHAVRRGARGPRRGGRGGVARAASPEAAAHAEGAGAHADENLGARALVLRDEPARRRGRLGARATAAGGISPRCKSGRRTPPSAALRLFR